MKPLFEGESYQKMIEKCKRESDYWPVIIKRRFGDGEQMGIIYSTIVRILRDGVWHNVHCLEGFEPQLNIYDDMVLFRLVKHVHEIQHRFIISQNHKHLWNIDPLQMEERDRLVENISRHEILIKSL